MYEPFDQRIGDATDATMREEFLGRMCQPVENDGLFLNDFVDSWEIRFGIWTVSWILCWNSQIQVLFREWFLFGGKKVGFYASLSHVRMFV